MSQAQVIQLRSSPLFRAFVGLLNLKSTFQCMLHQRSSLEQAILNRSIADVDAELALYPPHFMEHYMMNESECRKAG